MVKRRLWAAAGAILLSGYAWFLLRHNTFCVGGADSSGYINAARRMVAGKLVDRPRTLDRLGLSDPFSPLFIPLGFTIGPGPGTMAPYYPSGFPAHMALAALLTGWEHGPYLVSPILAVGSLWLFYLLVRGLGLPRSWAFAGAVMLGVWPVFLYQAIQPMSDVAATFWALASILFALRARRRTTWALASGAAMGIAVLVRPTNLLLAVPLTFALPLSISSLSLFAAGGIPFAAAFASYNLRCYGSALQSGYQKGSLASDLALANVPPRLLHYGGWVAKTLTPIVPLAWTAAAFSRRAAWRDRAMLISWFAAFFLFTCFYRPYDSFIFVRYLLPAAPALLAGALLAARDALARTRRAPVAAAIAFLLLATVLSTEFVFNRKLHVLSIADGEDVYPQACAWANRALPAQSVVLAMQTSGSLEYYTALSYARWDWIEPDRFSLLRARTEPKGYRWFALLFPFEVEELVKHTPGRWKEIGRRRQVTLFELEP